MNSRFYQWTTKVVAGCTVAALTFAPTFALAGGKGKSDRSSFSLSQSGNGNGNGGGNPGGGNSSMKFHASRSKSLSGISSNGGGNGGSGGTGGSSFSQSFSTKKSKSFGQLNQTQSFQNLYSTSNGNGNGGSNLSGIKKSGRNPRYSFPTMDQQNLADAVQTGKFKPIDSGIGNGTGGNDNGGTIKWPGKFTKVDHGQLADSLKKHKPFPIEGIRIGEPNGPGNGPGNGNGNGGGNGPGKGGKNKDCHDNDCNFPWWPIIVGGCYGGGYGGNCHNHNGCYDNYNGGCYNNGGYNGGYYNNTVSYPSVTNIVIEQPPVEPAAPQATLVTGIDLELLDVRLVDPGDAARNLGPRYRMTFGNRGTLPAGNFQVLLMASVDGKPQAGAPSATSEISGLASRQVFSADVRLPLTADLATLAKFIVVIDSAAQIGEPDENNNVAVVDREKIATVDATTVAVQ